MRPERHHTLHPAAIRPREGERILENERLRARLAALEAQAGAAVALLCRLEWDERLRCPVCRWTRESGHRAGCALAEAVRREP